MFLKIGELVSSESGNIFSVPLFMERGEKQPVVLGTITLIVPRELSVDEYMDLKERMKHLTHIALLNASEVRQFATVMEIGESILEEQENEPNEQKSTKRTEKES